ncbi:MAG: tetratricopeptide repeat protein [Desulfobacteraceae bacterium]|nr:MAG: tetratricopeptide repeat protein [Desulfobacteraceae bacterium]
MSQKIKENNIIRFPVERIKGRRPAPSDFPENPSTGNEYPEHQWMDIEDELWAKEDFEELILLHKKQLEEAPQDNFARFSLAQAYFFNYDYEKALETLHSLHKKMPDDPDILYFIVEVLLASGKTDDDFNWVEKPEIINLTETVMDACYNMLKPGYKTCSIDHLYNIFFEKGYLMFTQEHLLAALADDGRFLVTHPESSDTAEVGIITQPLE